MKLTQDPGILAFSPTAYRGTRSDERAGLQREDLRVKQPFTTISGEKSEECTGHGVRMFIHTLKPNLPSGWLLKATSLAFNGLWCPVHLPCGLDFVGIISALSPHPQPPLVSMSQPPLFLGGIV